MDQQSLSDKPFSILEELNLVLTQLNSTSLGRRAFLSAAPFLLATCASAPKTRYREGDNEGQSAALTVDEEKK